jgi:histidyl-tRNA synthetase
MEALGIPRGSYVVKVNNRKLLDGVLESLGLGGDANISKRLTVLRAIDKLDRLGTAGVKALLGTGRKDESGDYTRGAGLSTDQSELLLSIFASPETPADEVLTKIQLIGNAVAGQGVSELRQISDLVSAASYGDRISLDPSVVRGLEYYTGTVFEVGLDFQSDGADGSPQFGSPAGGGRYDGLVARFRGEPVPATGVSIGVSRLAAVLRYLGKLDSKPEPGPVVVTVFDKDRLADYQTMVATLRAAGIRAELYLGNPRNLGNQLKYADRRGAPCVVIQGSDEKAKGEVTIKDLIIGAELAKLEKGREQHLQKQAQAQRSVPEAQLVEAVREVLARHGGR